MDDGQLRKYSLELKRRRMVAGDKKPYPRSVAEVGLLLSFGQELSINHLRTTEHGVDLVSNDVSGREFCITSNVDLNEWMVPQEPAYDNYVFVRPVSTTEFEVAGWLPGNEVRGAPVERNFYVVSADNLIELNSELDLKTECPQLPCYENAVWFRDMMSWECATCGRYRYDQKLRDFELPDRPSDPVREGETTA
jgi:hypothetical protein